MLRIEKKMKIGVMEVWNVEEEEEGQIVCEKVKCSQFYFE
jgi:hypothetical protein